MLTVKYGLIRLISTKADLCDQVSNVDLECPMNKGKVSISKSVDLPNEIPPVRLSNLETNERSSDLLQGKYTAIADVYTADDVQITCLTATIAFSRGKGSFFDGEL